MLEEGDMKSINELDYYELLEISSAAAPSEIDRAYRLAQQTYAEGSLALYSVFEKFDAEAICGRLDEAYRVLSDPESREIYDREFDFGQQRSRAIDGLDSSSAVVSEFEEMTAAGAHSTNETTVDIFDDVVEEYDAFEDEGNGDYDGLRLRRTRLFKGYELEDISEVTKVSGRHLRNIEEENFKELPADVYVRGFVTAYAKTIGLDPTIVVPGYMARVAESREDGRPSRFRGRQ